jgi:hypothetical protein
LLDAGPIIEAHRCDCWSLIVSRFALIAPATVVDECKFFVDADRKQIPIDLQPQISAGGLSVWSASAADLRDILAALPIQLHPRLHGGELEALVYLRAHEGEDIAFVTADNGAVEATVILGMSDKAWSLERVLKSCGFTKSLKEEHTESMIARAKSKGGETLAQFANPIVGRKYKPAK